MTTETPYANDSNLRLPISTKEYTKFPHDSNGGVELATQDATDGLATSDSKYTESRYGATSNQRLSSNETSPATTPSRPTTFLQKYAPLDELPSLSRIRDLNIIGDVKLYYGWEFKTEKFVEYVKSITDWPVYEGVEPIVAPQSGCASDKSGHVYDEHRANLRALAYLRFISAMAEKYKINLTCEHVVTVYEIPYSVMIALWSNSDMKRKEEALGNHRLNTGELALEALKTELSMAFTRAGEPELTPKWYWSYDNDFE